MATNAEVCRILAGRLASAAGEVYAARWALGRHLNEECKQFLDRIVSELRAAEGMLEGEATSFDRGWRPRPAEPQCEMLRWALACAAAGEKGGGRG